MKWIALMIALFMNAMANILIKAGMRGFEGRLDVSALLYMSKNVYVILGLISFGGAFVGYSYVLSKMDLSVAYPIMTGAGFAIVAVVSSLWFGESFSYMKIVGITLIGIGIWIISKY